MDASRIHLNRSGADASKLTLMRCHGPLEVLHAHLVRAAHSNDSGDWILSYPEWVSPIVVEPRIWEKVLPLPDTRPEYGKAPAKIRKNLELLWAEVPFRRYAEINLAVSDLFWLENNVLVAQMARFCASERIRFGFSLTDEGAVLYTGTHLGVRRTLKSFAKYAYLRLHGFPAKLIYRGNANFLHPLCRKVFCLHPGLLRLPPHVEMEQIDPELMLSVYSPEQTPIQVPVRSCLYLSQPLYKATDMDRQLAVVRESKSYLQRQGIVHFYYKPHHADWPAWLQRLESDCGFQPLALRDQIPVEFVARLCGAEVIFGHSTSALLNVRLYGYRGRIISFGLHRLRGASEASQYTDYLSALKKLGQVELAG